MTVADSRGVNLTVPDLKSCMMMTWRNSTLKVSEMWTNPLAGLLRYLHISLKYDLFHTHHFSQSLKLIISTVQMYSKLCLICNSVTDYTHTHDE